jgi:hypothetical protein
MISKVENGNEQTDDINPKVKANPSNDGFVKQLSKHYKT